MEYFVLIPLFGDGQSYPNIKIEHLFVKSVFNEQFDEYNKIDYSRGINHILIPLFFTKKLVRCPICKQNIY